MILGFLQGFKEGLCIKSTWFRKPTEDKLGWTNVETLAVNKKYLLLTEWLWAVNKACLVQHYG